VPLSVAIGKRPNLALGQFWIFADSRSYSLLSILALENAGSAKFGPVRAQAVTEYLCRNPGESNTASADKPASQSCPKTVMPQACLPEITGPHTLIAVLSRLPEQDILRKSPSPAWRKGKPEKCKKTTVPNKLK
jgi:hypothetical protein